MMQGSPKAIAESLNGAQREIVRSGPTSFADADAIPEGLFDYDLSWDRDGGDELHVWEPTELGRAVRDLIEAEDHR